MVLTLLLGQLWIGHPGYPSGLWQPEECGSGRLGLQEPPGSLGSQKVSVATAGFKGLALFQGQCLRRAVLPWLE